MTNGPGYVWPVDRFYSSENRAGFSVGSAQWQGTRQTQNDVVYVNDPQDPRGIILAIVDGIGLEREAGDAARDAMLAIRREFEESDPDEAMDQAALRMLGKAHRGIRQRNERYFAEGKPQVGATGACALIRNNQLTFASVGNVRVFLLRNGLLLQLNRDHILSLEAEERDILRGDAPDLNPEWARQVTSYLGMEGLSKLDCQHNPIPLLPGDRIMLISSGLYSVLEEEEFSGFLTAGPAGWAAEKIVERVKSYHPNSQSNVSLVVAALG